VLEPDDTVRLFAGQRLGSTASARVTGQKNLCAIPIAYPYLLADVSVGDRILMSDGTIELKVEDKSEEDLICRVITEGEIQSHKGVNLPTSALRVPAFTKKDRRDLHYGLDRGVDFVALSFVRSEQDLQPVIAVLEDAPYRPLLIAKIERPEAVERIDAILPLVDGIMVARGDLGVEMSFAEVPVIQKQLINAARSWGKPVITATQMLRSMTESPRPTRAEAADVANAIFDGTDAVMLSEETATGQYPVEAVKVLDRVAVATEPHVRPDSLAEPPDVRSTESAVGRTAAVLARDCGAVAIVAFTTSGSTARYVARTRPAHPIVALTASEQTERQLALTWGVHPLRVGLFDDTDAMFEAAVASLLANDLAKKGDLAILTAGVPLRETGNTNLLRVMQL
jgi:pyruvate kinase